MADTPFTRLHITPLDADLLKVVVPAAVLPQARNISFHSIETFPERRFGFVDLPQVDAEKIRKKLNGAILKGVKLRIEPARKDDMPKPDPKATVAADAPPTDKQKKSKSKDGSSKKRKRDSKEIAGIELEEGRNVKRGWTEPEGVRPKKDKDRKHKKKEKEKNRQAKSKYTNEPECLVKTILPANVASTLGSSSKDARKKKGKSREVTVHEFEKSTKFPTFLKTIPQDAARPGSGLEFVDGKGWVDKDGNVVEAAKTRPAPAANPREERRPAATAADDSDDTSSSGTSSEDEDDDEEESDSEPEAGASTVQVAASTSTKLATEGLSKPDKDASILESPRPKSSGSTRSLTIKIPPVTPAAPKIHPLEALYKRANKDGGDLAAPSGASDSKPFSFFDADDEDMEDPDDLPTRGSQVPMTPFTRQDLEHRNIRSAAPTPDTAHPSRSFKLWPPDNAEADIEEGKEGGEDEDDEGSEKGEDGVEEAADSDEAASSDEDEQAPGASGQAATATGDFQKWFWEHRGDLNRSWKKRRKMASKQKRYRDNRARANRAL